MISANPETVDGIIKATVCLHNFIKHQKEDAHRYCSSNFIDQEKENGMVTPGQWRTEVKEGSALRPVALRFGNRNYVRKAFNFRDYLKNYFNTIGSVSWQRDHVRQTN